MRSATLAFSVVRPRRRCVPLRMTVALIHHGDPGRPIAEFYSIGFWSDVLSHAAGFCRLLLAKLADHAVPIAGSSAPAALQERSVGAADAREVSTIRSSTGVSRQVSLRLLGWS